MRNRAVRALLVLLALVAQAGAGYRIWQLEGQIAAVASDAGAFESRIRQLAVDLAYLGSSQQAYLAEGQDPQSWMKRTENLTSALSTQLAGARTAARSPEAQGALEDAVETIGAFAQTDARAREYIDATQRLSAADIIFTDGASQVAKATASVDQARLREAAARATETANLRQMQLYFLGGAAALTLLVLLLLFPVPRRAVSRDSEEEDAEYRPASGGLGLNQVSRAPAVADENAGDAAIDLSTLDSATIGGETAAKPPAAPTAATIVDVAGICGSLARVKEPRELPPLLERVGNVLDAAGLIIWMPDGPKGSLRPVLAHGYQPLAITRMGTIAIDADNATALAFRTHAQHMVPAEAGSNAAIVSPLVTAEGCSGVMAVELKPGVDASDHYRSLAAIVSAQLATLIAPAPEGGQAGSTG